ncbi:MAG: TetR/AcrR family transcriptional regulator [Alteromonadaceae bacterium]|jgi:TetR/AcrR family transcriptional regulator
MPAKNRSNRKEQILQCLAVMLENNPGQRITTAKLALQVGVSEAALYRHFPSKARMFEGLIDFIEESLLTRINLIIDKEKLVVPRVEKILGLLLGFAEKNPGISRILNGDALLGEQDRLRGRIGNLYNKLETQLKQVLREYKLREGKNLGIEESLLANILLSYAEGRINQFVRSDFKRLPSVEFASQWQHMQSRFF